MTDEEMAAALRANGWRVKEPLTQANCRHPRMQSSGTICSDGSGSSRGYCPDCGYTYDESHGPNPNYVRAPTPYNAHS